MPVPDEINEKWENVQKPFKQISLPRFELNAAVLISDLMELVKSKINVQINRTTYYSDSQVTLGWINASPTRWNSEAYGNGILVVSSII